MSKVKTVVLLGALTGILLFIGGLAGGRSGMLIALIMAGTMNFVSYWFSDKIVLKIYGASALNESEAPRLYAMVRELCQRAQVPMPAMYVFEQDSPNAFATGRNPQKAVIALSRGILKLLSEEELKGVIAHELTHVLNRDTLLQTVAATLAGAIMFLAYQARWFGVFAGGRDDDERGGILGLMLMAILAPLAASLIQMAISRSREYKADEGAARLTHHPEGLASALEKLSAYSTRLPLPATGQTAHLFIVSPLSGRSLMNLFSTHPPIAERVARLRAMRLA
ncbi:MAG: zinc metalloprotease HtpX [Acidobacteria bacterium]|jgi:heat shock protein HtpX|nr:zinc metalloprotease HtpX [Acidobacteriota bacterium]